MICVKKQLEICQKIYFFNLWLEVPATPHDLTKLAVVIPYCIHAHSYIRNTQLCLITHACLLPDRSCTLLTQNKTIYNISSGEITGIHFVLLNSSMMVVSGCVNVISFFCFDQNLNILLLILKATQRTQYF